MYKHLQKLFPPVFMLPDLPYGYFHIALIFVGYISTLAESLFIGRLVFGDLPHPVPKSGGFEGDHAILPDLWNLATIDKDGDGFPSFRIVGKMLGIIPPFQHLLWNFFLALRFFPLA